MNRHKLARRPMLGVATATLGPVACSGGEKAVVAEQGTALGIDPAVMDKSVKPGDDFYAFANGGWMKATEIPADRSNVGGFWIADQQTEKRLEELVAGASSTAMPDADSDAARVKAFYHAYLDTAAIDQARPGAGQGRSAVGSPPLPTTSGLSRVLGEQLRADVDPLNATDFFTENLFGVFVTQALAGGEVMPYLLQGGLGMPEREYYLSSDPEMAALRTQYRKYIEDVRDARPASPIAAAHGAAHLRSRDQDRPRPRQPRGERRLVRKAQRSGSRADFAAKAPGLDWEAFFAGAQPRRAAEVRRLSRQPSAKLSALVESRAAAGVEGLAGLPPDQQQRRRAADQVRRPALRLLRHAADRRAAAAPA